MSDSERLPGPSRPKLLVLGSAAAAVLVAVAIVVSLAYTTAPGSIAPVSLPTPSSTASAADDRDAGPAPSPSPAPPTTANPVPESPPPRASGPKQGGPGTGSPPSGVTPDVGAVAPSAGIVLGRTIDDLAQSHTLVLNVAPALQQTLLDTNELFAVVSGSTTFYVTGDAAVGAWRFGADSSAAGDAAAIIVIKHATNASAQALAADPSRFTAGSALNEDAVATSLRLSALMATAVAETDPMYSDLSRQLQDPMWTGVLVFGASVLALPVEVEGQSTAGLADTPVTAFVVGFDAAPVSGGSTTQDTLFGIVDYARPVGDPAPPGGLYLRAAFANSLLTFFEIG
jgi:hypothetical protein